MPDEIAPLDLHDSIILLGAGRLGLHLAWHLRAAGATRIILWNRGPLPETRKAMLELEGPFSSSPASVPPVSPASLEEPAPDLLAQSPSPAGSLNVCIGPLPALEIARARLILLTAADDALEPLARRLAAEAPPSPSTPVLHCSGALNSLLLRPLADLGVPTGSMHPLQSFSGMPALHGLRGTWFALEGHDQAVSTASRVVAWLEGREVRLRPEGKVFYHASAVVASNLMVALTALAVDLMERATGPEVDGQRRLELLLPLIEGTVSNLRRVGLPGALTGPISRGDAGVVARHLAAIGTLEGRRKAGSESEAGSTPEAGSRVNATQETTPKTGADPVPDQRLIYRELSKQALRLAQAQGLSPEACQAIQALLTAPYTNDPA